MKLLTKELVKRIPRLGKTDGQYGDAIAWVKFFAPWSGWRWYVTECDARGDRCFGLVSGHEVELGYFSVKELESIQGPWMLTIERDLYFQPTPLREIPECPEWLKRPLFGKAARSTQVEP